MLLSPAYKSEKFIEGDVLTKIDNRQVEGLNVQQVSEMMIGQTGSEVLVTIRRVGTPDAVEVALIRGGISLKMPGSESVAKMEKVIMRSAKVPPKTQRSAPPLNAPPKPSKMLAAKPTPDIKGLPCSCFRGHLSKLISDGD